MTGELTEIQMESVTSKGSKFRKSVHEYDSIDSKNENNKLIVEINSFANPLSYKVLSVKSLLHDFLKQTGNEEITQQYNLQPFQINVVKNLLKSDSPHPKDVASTLIFATHRKFL